MFLIFNTLNSYKYFKSHSNIFNFPVGKTGRQKGRSSQIYFVPYGTKDWVFIFLSTDIRFLTESKMKFIQLLF